MHAQSKQPVYRTIADDLRNLIRAKHLPGDLLPSEADLSAKYDVNRHTIRHALDLLSRENIISRHHRRGSIVQDRKAVGEFAIVMHSRDLDADVHPFFNLVNGAIIRLLAERNPRWHVKLHVGKLTKTAEEFSATLDLLAPDVLRNLRGVFTFHPLYGVGAQLQTAKVPVVAFVHTEAPHVVFDDKTLFDLGVPLLKTAGCRTIGMIHAETSAKCARININKKLFQHAAKKCGLKICPEWMAPDIFANDFMEQDGYELMTRHWKSRPHPDGILVLDDVLCRGVLRASVQLGIKFPRDLRLVTLANRGVALNYHKPVSRVEFNPEELARHAVDMMMTLVEGRTLPSTAIELTGELIKGETT